METTIPTEVPNANWDERRWAADIAEQKAKTIKTYVDAGFTPESARDAVVDDDLSLLATA